MVLQYITPAHEKLWDLFTTCGISPDSISVYMSDGTSKNDRHAINNNYHHHIKHHTPKKYPNNTSSKNSAFNGILGGISC